MEIREWITSLEKIVNIKDDGRELREMKTAVPSKLDLLLFYSDWNNSRSRYLIANIMNSISLSLGGLGLGIRVNNEKFVESVHTIGNALNSEYTIDFVNRSRNNNVESHEAGGENELLCRDGTIGGVLYRSSVDTTRALNNVSGGLYSSGSVTEELNVDSWWDSG